VLGGRLLSNLSHQANYLGRYDEAIQFARAAQTSGRGRASDTVTAMFLAMEARALASSGEARLCARAPASRPRHRLKHRDVDPDAPALARPALGVRPDEPVTADPEVEAVAVDLLHVRQGKRQAAHVIGVRTRDRRRDMPSAPTRPPICVGEVSSVLSPTCRRMASR
jgi:hypothetical protein